MSTPGTPTNLGRASLLHGDLLAGIRRRAGASAVRKLARRAGDTARTRCGRGHAAYCGEITMVDTWLGFLLKSVENMGLTDKTTVIFTTDHGFYFGEHGGLFGKMNSDKYPDGTLRPYGEAGIDVDTLTPL